MYLLVHSRFLHPVECAVGQRARVAAGSAHTAQHCFRRPAWKYRQWLRAEAAACQELFALFDEDCDGRLSKTEYASYLRGIGLWTKCEEVLVKGEWRGYTAKAWDRQWAEDCNRLKQTKQKDLTSRSLKPFTKLAASVAVRS